MKEYAPEKYAELSTILEEAFETNSVELYQKAAKYMVDWEKSFVQPDKSIESEIVHYDKKANHLPAYSGIFDVDKTIATAVENCSKEEQAFVYDIIRNNFMITNSSSMTEEERQANISLGMKKAEYAANDFIDADYRKAFLDAMETVAKLASAGKADGHGNMDYGVNKANYLGSGANMVQTTDPLDVMQKSDSKAYEEYQRLRSTGNDAESGANAFKYLVKWYSNAVSNNNKLIENYEKKSQEYVEEKVKNQTIDKTFADVKTENARQFVQSLMNFQNNRPNFLTPVLQRELALFSKR